MTITRQIWSKTIDKNIAVKELSADKNTISQWFKRGNALANIWNGRSYAQVVGPKRRLPVSAACILQTPDRNANAKKVKDFLKISKPVTFNPTSSRHAQFSSQCADSHVCVAKKQAYAHHKPMHTKTSVTTSVAPITLTNRFHGLSVEDVMPDNSVGNTSPVLF